MAAIELLELIELCYASVADEAAWSVFLAACCNAFGATGASIGTISMQPRRLEWFTFHGFDPIIETEYAVRSVEDPRASLIPGLKPGQGYLFDRSGHDIDAFKRSTYFVEFQGKLDVLWAVIARLDEAKDIDGLWAVHRPEREPAFTAKDLRRAEILARHIGRARRLQVDLDLAEGRAALGAALLDRLPVGLVFLTRERRVLEVNLAARAMAAHGDGLALRRDALVIGDDTTHRALQRMIDAAARGELDGVGGVLGVPRPSGKPDYAVSVVRCFADLGRIVGPRAAVLVAIADPARETSVSADALRALWQLTATEAQVALSLAAGRNLNEVAQQQGIARETARVHLKRILAKSGAHRQSELVRLILSGPGALPASGQRQSALVKSNGAAPV